MSDSEAKPSESVSGVAQDSQRSRSWGSRLRWWADPRSWLRSILTLDDTPHSIALGVSIGVFVGVTPTEGIQVGLVLLIATLTQPFFRFNRLAGIIAVHISNPLTTIPLLWINYRVGSMFFSQTPSREQVWKMIRSIDMNGFWGSMKTLIVAIGQPLLVGSLIVGAIGGLVTYPLIRWVLSRFPQHKRAQVF